MKEGALYVDTFSNKKETDIIIKEIENHLSNDGLQYTFNNSYPTASMTLSDESAIFITTRSPNFF